MNLASNSWKDAKKMPCVFRLYLDKAKGRSYIGMTKDLPNRITRIIKGECPQRLRKDITKHTKRAFEIEIFEYSEGKKTELLAKYKNRLYE